MTALLILGLCFLSGTISFLVGWAFALKFRLFYNWINFLRGRDEYESSIELTIDVYASDDDEALAIQRLMKRAGEKTY